MEDILIWVFIIIYSLVFKFVIPVGFVVGIPTLIYWLSTKWFKDRASKNLLVFLLLSLLVIFYLIYSSWFGDIVRTFSSQYFPYNE